MGHMPVGYLHILFGKMFVQILSPFFNWVVFLSLSCISSLYTWGIKHIGYIICKYLLPFSRLSFHFVDGFFCCAEAFSLMWSHFFFLNFFSLSEETVVKDIVKINVKEHMLSPRNLMVSDLTFKSLKHFKLIIVYGVRQWLISFFFFLVQVAMQFSQYYLLKRLFFLLYMFFTPLT